MKRILATLRSDIRLQFRNGFYYVSGFVAVLIVITLKQFGEVNWLVWWPAIILENLVINGFFFMAGLVLLEKNEGTLEAQIVSPLRPWEYLLSKALSLGLLSLVETLVVVALVSGVGFNWALLALGVLTLTLMYALYGFIVVARYHSISEFLMPSAVWTMGFSLPLLYYFGLWRSWVMYLHPLQAPVVLMQAAFQRVEAWQLAYGLAYSALWVVVGVFASQRAFHRFVVQKRGARRK